MTYTEHEYLLNKPINPATSPDVGGIFQAVTPPPGPHCLSYKCAVNDKVGWGSLQLDLVGVSRNDCKTRAVFSE